MLPDAYLNPIFPGISRNLRKPSAKWKKSSKMAPRKAHANGVQKRIRKMKWRFRLFLGSLSPEAAWLLRRRRVFGNFLPRGNLVFHFSRAWPFLFFAFWLFLCDREKKNQMQNRTIKRRRRRRRIIRSKTWTKWRRWRRLWTRRRGEGKKTNQRMKNIWWRRKK